MDNKNSKVKSLAKAMVILECFSKEKPELGITEISEMVEMNKSNVHNIISTFQQLGYIEKCKNGKYTLGLKLLEYSFIINQHLGYPQAIYDVIFNVSNKMDEIVYFGLPWGTDVLYLYVVHPISKLHVMPYRNILGEKSPLYCTGIGKAILASFPAEEWPKRITSDRKPYTSSTILDYDLIIEDLKKTYQRGYSIDNCEREPGIRCVGVPVKNKNGELIGGLSLSGPLQTMTDEKIVLCAEELTTASLIIKERLYR